jgi:hypothetical protein
MMHMTVRPGNDTDFANWFCRNVFDGYLKDDTTLWNFAIHASLNNPNEFWLYQTFQNEKYFLTNAESIYMASFSFWWNQAQAETSIK